MESNNFHKLLQERIEKANPRRELTTEKRKLLQKLETIAEKLKRGENVKNRQIQASPSCNLASRLGLYGLQPSLTQSN
jgi:cell shape-determining protein MreC